MRGNWRRGALVPVVAMMVALLPGFRSAALAAPSGPEPSGPRTDPQLIDNQNPTLLAMMRTQERLHPAAQALLEASLKLPANSGYAGVAYEGESVVLYYKGVLPSQMVVALTAARKAAPVAVKAAAYSHFELEAAQTKIFAAVAAQPRSTGVVAIGCRLIVSVLR